MKSNLGRPNIRVDINNTDPNESENIMRLNNNLEVNVNNEIKLLNEDINKKIANIEKKDSELKNETKNDAKPELKNEEAVVYII